MREVTEEMHLRVHDRAPAPAGVDSPFPWEVMLQLRAHS